MAGNLYLRPNCWRLHWLQDYRNDAPWNWPERFYLFPSGRNEGRECLTDVSARLVSAISVHGHFWQCWSFRSEPVGLIWKPILRSVLVSIFSDSFCLV